MTPEDLLNALSLLSEDEQIEFLRSWAPLHHKPFRGALADMLRDLERPVALAFFRAWVGKYADDTAFLRAVLAEARKAVATNGYKSPDNSKRIQWIEAALDKEPDVRPAELAARCARVFGHAEYDGEYVDLAQTVKHCRGARMRQRDLRERAKTGAPAPVRAPRPKHPACTADAEEQYVRSMHTLDDLYAEMAPYERCLRQPWDIWDRLHLAGRFLSEHGDCSSVVSHRIKDREAHDWRRVPAYRSVVEKVSVFDHSYFVCKAALELCKTEHEGAASWVGPSFAMGITHDLGKIAHVRVVSNRDDHPFASADKFKTFFRDSKAPWVRDVARAIEGHHKAGPPTLMGDMLKEADARAREIEFKEDFARDGLIQSFRAEVWFDPEEFIEELAPVLNRLYSGSNWVFNHHDVVYSTMDPLLACLGRLAVKKRCFDPRVARSADSETMLRFIADKLRDANVIAGTLQQGYHGRKYWIHYSDWTNSVRRYLLPMKLDAFGLTMAKAKNMQTGIVRRIAHVVSDDGTGD
jgi:hypothetical protein